ncbi:MULTISPECIES: glutamate--cysteine ligase [Commensalibacter]|uniref:Glutamate--cysteine ligase n=1 Tax=Commensalibacter papalotli (ex Servin-Garciduenas et al. 2014) TaxID=1208583 RepID=W7DSP0_9PROT|nr:MULTISPECIES: glutamate--cysteine ligase [Commensalibacter]EUK17940.1 glutamate--cysteine ligase [Commensalibacter papalotli (ex Servin-Garciduenas et al. 2014)]CAI3941412.1 Gamma-glutamylcysteine synthetase (Gsh2) (PDB:2GWD) [Commensalibacter papalotli (ex Botero et al. 2024)]
MSSILDQDQTPITSTTQLAEHLAEGCKPTSKWRIGTEHEKFGFILNQENERYLLPPAYEPNGINAILTSMQRRNSEWKGIYDQGNLIGFDTDRGAISLEPAGQFELSGAPVNDIHAAKQEIELHFQDVHQAADPLNIGFAPIGFHPFATRAQMPWMPKERYKIMKAYMPKVGTLGLDMMTRTCTVQVNLDFSSEEDMARKMRVSLALQPLATALFANSPFYEGKPSGYQSTRAHIWTDTDNNRSGMPPAFFEEGFGFEQYVEWLIDVPMYFVIRDGKMIDVAGESFRNWLNGKAPNGFENQPVTMGDFKNHITTAFPDVRLKQYIEMRGADAGSQEMMLAMSAFWTGLLYDSATLIAAEKLVKEYSWQEYIELRPQVIKSGLSVLLGKENLRHFGKRILALAMDGLKARHLQNLQGQDERIFLAPLEEIVHGGPCQAEYWLQRYATVWQGNVKHILDEAKI